MYGTFCALLPPIIAILMALITKEVYSSMLLGILVGALFAAGFSPIGTLNLIIVDGFSASASALAGNFCFLIFLGALIHLIEKSGGSLSFGNWASRGIKSRSGVQAATFGLGLLIFIDDYFNCLTVGSVMRPATDKWRVSREKLAYLVDATAAPVCMIAPISSWAAAVAGVAADLGTGITGTQLFIRAIPYNFYSLLTLVFIIALIVMKADYGKMRVAEEKAQHDPPEVLSAEDEEEQGGKGSTIDLVLPVVVLIGAVFISMLYAGGYFGSTPWMGSENAGNLIGALGDTDSFIALPMGTFVTLLFTCAFYALRRVLRFKEMVACIPEGFRNMIPAILILTLAMTLKTVTSALGADMYIQGMMRGVSSGLTSLLPAVIFLAAVGFSFSTGTSWGSFGILIPIVTAVFSANDPLLIIGVSACLAGSICGDHCSPISDTTIMASAGAQVDHVEHVTPQLPYALTVAGICFLTYIVAGFVQSAWLSLLVGVALTVGTLWVIRYARKKRNSNSI